MTCIWRENAILHEMWRNSDQEWSSAILISWPFLVVEIRAPLPHPLLHYWSTQGQCFSCTGPLNLHEPRKQTAFDAHYILDPASGERILHADYLRRRDKQKQLVRQWFNLLAVHHFHTSPDFAILPSEHPNLAHGYHGFSKILLEYAVVPVLVNAVSSAGVAHQSLIGGQQTSMVNEIMEIPSIKFFWSGIQVHTDKHIRIRALRLQVQLETRGIRVGIRFGDIRVEAIVECDAGGFADRVSP